MGIRNFLKLNMVTNCFVAKVKVRLHLFCDKSCHAQCLHPNVIELER